MSYEIEKYRDKREKVLGVRKRGLSFGAIATIVSLVILVGMGTIVIPKSLAYINTRNLDDVVYKISNKDSWSADSALHAPRCWRH